MTTLEIRTAAEYILKDFCKKKNVTPIGYTIDEKSQSVYIRYKGKRIAQRGFTFHDLLSSCEMLKKYNHDN